MKIERIFFVTILMVLMFTSCGEYSVSSRNVSDATIKNGYLNIRTEDGGGSVIKMSDIETCAFRCHWNPPDDEHWVIEIYMIEGEADLYGTKYKLDPIYDLISEYLETKISEKEPK